MTDFYGINPGTVPGFAEAGAGRFMSVGGLPGHTVQHMLMFMDKLRGMHEADASPATGRADYGLAAASGGPGHAMVLNESGCSRGSCSCHSAREF
jgi:hypothetical protein